MRICRGCGGVLGRDCWNEEECVWIGEQHDQAAYQAAAKVPEYESDILSLNGQIEQLQAENEMLKKMLKGGSND